MFLNIMLGSIFHFLTNNDANNKTSKKDRFEKRTLKTAIISPLQKTASHLSVTNKKGEMLLFCNIVCFSIRFSFGRHRHLDSLDRQFVNSVRKRRFYLYSCHVLFNSAIIAKQIL